MITARLFHCSYGHLTRVLRQKLWTYPLRLIPHCLMSTIISFKSKYNKVRKWWQYFMGPLNTAAEVEVPCSGKDSHGSRKSVSAISPNYSTVCNRQPCIPLRNFMCTTLFYITFILQSITARPFSLTELVKGFSIGGKITVRVMAFKMPGICQLGLRLRLWLVQCRKSSEWDSKLGLMHVWVTQCVEFRFSLYSAML